MTSSEPIRTAASRIRSALIGRRRARLGAVTAVLLVAVTACAGSTKPVDVTDRTSSDGSQPRARGTLPSNGSPPRVQVTLSSDGWPRYGQGAYVLGDGQPVSSPEEQPVPIASVAKVMTAYLVLKHYPIRAGDSGGGFVVGQGDVADAEARRREGQSVVDVRAGEQLTERDALMAILLPSANNIAVLVARQVAGSVPAFVAKMNDTARALGMSHTTYTDPSGYDAGTVSTAADQLRLAQLVAADGTLAAMMATSSYSLPVAGVVTNTDSLLGHDGFVGMKTGSDNAAGGCFMFRSERRTETGNATMIGVVLGQKGNDLITAGLDAAEQLVDHVAPNAAAQVHSDK